MRKVGTAPADALDSVRADEKQRLASGSMPIDKAMQHLAVKGRMGASPDIMPSASRDIAPLQGWTKLPGTVPPAMTAVPAASTPAPADSAAPSSSAATSPSGPPAKPAPSGPEPHLNLHPGRGNPPKAP
jgi:hypothetical protein